MQGCTRTTRRGGGASPTLRRTTRSSPRAGTRPPSWTWRRSGAAGGGDKTTAVRGLSVAQPGSCAPGCLSTRSRWSGTSWTPRLRTHGAFHSGTPAIRRVGTSGSRPSAGDRWHANDEPGRTMGDLVALWAPLRHATFREEARADLPERIRPRTGPAGRRSRGAHRSAGPTDGRPTAAAAPLNSGNAPQGRPRVSTSSERPVLPLIIVHRRLLPTSALTAVRRTWQHG